MIIELVDVKGPPLPIGAHHLRHQRVGEVVVQREAEVVRQRAQPGKGGGDRRPVHHLLRVAKVAALGDLGLAGAL